MGSGGLVKITIFSFILFFAGMFFTSCSESEPEITDSVGYVVLDYFSESGTPSARISVFAETKSDVHRVDRIQLECVANKHKWICSDPLIFGNEKKQWAGYTDFYVPVSENVKSGMYELNYIDAQENVVSRIINLNYDTDFLKMTGNQAALAEKKDFREEIAVYSESGTLLFYGMRKNNWRNDSSIFSSNRGAASYRVCYVSKVNSLVLMMPPVYKNKENKETK